MTTPCTGQMSYPMVLLGTRAALKDDLGYPTAELAYSAMLRLPGEFFSASDNTLPLPPTMPTNVIRPCTASGRHQHVRLCYTRFFIPQEFYTCTHVFVSFDTVRKPLQQPYDVGILTNKQPIFTSIQPAYPHKQPNLPNS